MYLLALLDPFTDPNDRFPHPFYILQLVKSLPFIYVKPEKGRLAGGASPYRPS